MDLTLADLVLYLVLGSCALVAAFTMASRIRYARVEKQALVNRVICRLCLHAFEDSSHARTVDCPVCGANNEKGRSRTLG